MKARHDKGITEGITETKMGLTKKQAHFLKVIKDFIASNGYSPSYEEMKQMNREQRRAAEKRRKKRKLPFRGFGAKPN